MIRFLPEKNSSENNLKSSNPKNPNSDKKGMRWNRLPVERRRAASRGTGGIFFYLITYFYRISIDIMSFFKKKQLVLRGIIHHKASGIYITLPPKWDAYVMDHNTFMIGKGNTAGTALIFTVLHHVTPGTVPLVNPLTGDEIIPEWTTDGKFDCFVTEYGPDKFLKVWSTETERYFIRFTYIYSKKNMESDGEKINGIVHSLSIFQGNG